MLGLEINVSERAVRVACMKSLLLAIYLCIARSRIMRDMLDLVTRSVPDALTAHEYMELFLKQRFA